MLFLVNKKLLKNFKQTRATHGLNI